MAIGISPTSAKGDILSFDGSSRTRVAVGTNGQILTARSSAASGFQYETANVSSPKFELISTTTLTANAATFTFSSIPAAYKWLKIIGNVNSNSTSGCQPTIILNSDTSLSNYYHLRYRSGATVSSSWSNNINGVTLNFSGSSGEGSAFEINIPKNTTTNHETIWFSRLVDHSYNNSTIRWNVVAGYIMLGSELTSIKFRNISTDVFGTGSSFHLYGSKA